MNFNAVPSADLNSSKQQASEMVAQVLIRPTLPPLPLPCPASIRPSHSPYHSALGNDIRNQANKLAGGPTKLKSRVSINFFLSSPSGLNFLHPRIPAALERHGEGRLDLEQLYAMVLPSAHKTATTEHGRCLLSRLIQHSAPAQRHRLVLRLLPFLNTLAIDYKGHQVVDSLFRCSGPDLQHLLLKELEKAVVELSFCSPGSRVIQTAVKSSIPGAAAVVDITQKLADNCFQLAKDKFGSKVLCTLLTCVAPLHTAALRSNLIRLLKELPWHAHGHRVVKRLYHEGSSKECAAISKYLLNNLQALMGSPHGSQLIRSVVLSRAPKSGDRGWQVLDKLVMLGVDLSENKGTRAVQNVLEMLAREPATRKLASGYLANTGAVVNEMSKRSVARSRGETHCGDALWREKGHRIEEYSWMQELACGGKPALAAPDLPKLLLLLEITNGVLNKEEDVEVRKKNSACIKETTVALLKECEIMLKTGNATVFELDEVTLDSDSAE